MIAILLWYLLTGSLVWMLVDAIGITKQSRLSPLKLVAATAVMILTWPRFAWKLASHPRWTARAIKRNLWGAR